MPIVPFYGGDDGGSGTGYRKRGTNGRGNMSHNLTVLACNFREGCQGGLNLVKLIGIVAQHPRNSRAMRYDQHGLDFPNAGEIRSERV